MSVGGLRPHIVVTKNDGVVFKRIENDLPGGSRLVLHSDNPAFAPYAVAGDDVVEVWRAAAYLSFELPSALGWTTGFRGELAQRIGHAQRRNRCAETRGTELIKRRRNDFFDVVNFGFQKLLNPTFQGLGA